MKWHVLPPLLRLSATSTRNGWPECCFENCLMRLSGALTVNIIGFGRPVIGSGAITTIRNLAVPDMDGITIFPYFKILPVAFNKLVKISASLYCNIFFELVPVKTIFSTVSDYLWMIFYPLVVVIAITGWYSYLFTGCFIFYFKIIKYKSSY